MDGWMGCGWMDGWVVDGLWMRWSEEWVVDEVV